MNKYALILPLVVLSFFVGYFASSSKMEHVYLIATVSTVFVAIAGFLLFLKHQKVGDSKRKRKEKVAAAFIAVLLFSTLIGVQVVELAAANPTPVYSLEMPEEYINYTISRVNGSLWAKVDGTYPLRKFGIECQDQSGGMNNTWFTFTGDTLPMVYPTPPGTTNISVKVDETELEWSNYTQNFPDATHYTAIGDWSMISCTIHSVLDQFMLKIHYEHPILLMNGSYTFLYDLNISPYLLPWSNKSTAHFNIRFETGYTDLQADTIAVDGTLKPVEYTVTKEDATETVSLQVVSEYSQTLPGDLLISFHEGKDSEQTNSGFLGSTLWTEYGYALVAMIVIVVVGMVGILSFKHKKGGDKK
jgi:NADH:ubiquinone oxidoreductase subunit 6 (subunit J)